MKKNDLIKLLTEIKGNPDIVLWNGYVDDWMPIAKKLTELELVKESADHLREAINWKNLRDGLDPITDEELAKVIKEHYSDWDLPNEFVLESEMVRWYGTKRKKIVVLQAETRGKECFDRGGSIEY